MPTVIPSNIMHIEIVGSTVRYRYLHKSTHPETYELRDLSLFDLAKLKAAGPNDALSASATVEYIGHLFPSKLFNSAGQNVKPTKRVVSILKTKTPYR